MGGATGGGTGRDDGGGTGRDGGGGTGCDGGGTGRDGGTTGRSTTADWLLLLLLSFLDCTSARTRAFASRPSRTNARESLATSF